MPTFVVTDARGEQLRVEVPRETLELCGGVLEALAADDAPNPVVLADVGLGALSATQFARAVRASYQATAWERLAEIGAAIALDEWGALESAVSWLGAREATRYAAASKIAGAADDELAQRLRGWRGGWDAPANAEDVCNGDRGLVFGACVRRASTGTAEDVERLFNASCASGCEDSVAYLWSLHRTGGLAAGVRLNPGARKSRSFWLAARRGHLHILEFLWRVCAAEGAEVDPAADDSAAFSAAAAYGHLPVLEFLWRLKEEAGIEIEPAAEDNKAFREAAANGHLPVLEFLWRLKKEHDVAIYPGENADAAFRAAAAHGHLPVLQFLWRLRVDEGVEIDPAADYNNAIYMAARNGHLHVLEWLWQIEKEAHVGIDPAARNSFAFRLAASTGHREVLEYLWRLKKEEGVAIDPGADDFASVRHAAARGHLTVIEFLWGLHASGEIVIGAAAAQAAYHAATAKAQPAVIAFLESAGVRAAPAAGVEEGGAGEASVVSDESR